MTVQENVLESVSAVSIVDRDGDSVAVCIAGDRPCDQAAGRVDAQPAGQAVSRVGQHVVRIHVTGGELQADRRAFHTVLVGRLRQHGCVIHISHRDGEDLVGDLDAIGHLQGYRMIADIAVCWSAGEGSGAISVVSEGQPGRQGRRGDDERVAGVRVGGSDVVGVDCIFIHGGRAARW